MYDRDYKPYTAKRWTEAPTFTVIGHRESTEEEKKKTDEEATEVLRMYGVIGKNEKVDGDKVVKIDTPHHEG